MLSMYSRAFQVVHWCEHKVPGYARDPAQGGISTLEVSKQIQQFSQSAAPVQNNRFFCWCLLGEICSPVDCRHDDVVWLQGAARISAMQHMVATAKVRKKREAMVPVCHEVTSSLLRNIVPYHAKMENRILTQQNYTSKCMPSFGFGWTTTILGRFLSPAKVQFTSCSSKPAVHEASIACRRLPHHHQLFTRRPLLTARRHVKHAYNGVLPWNFDTSNPSSVLQQGTP